MRGMDIGELGYLHTQSADATGRDRAGQGRGTPCEMSQGVAGRAEKVRTGEGNDDLCARCGCD
jgi:hypothetical protein